jgi:putative oxidoreductase
MVLSDELLERSTNAGPAVPSRMSSTGLLMLRVFGGAFLIAHAVQKLSDYGDFAGSVRALGWPLPDIAAALTVAGEAGLGALLLLGMTTRLAGALLGVLMALVWVSVHASQGFLIPGKPGINGESALLYLLIGLTMATTGAGMFSVDHVLRGRAGRAGG